MTALNGTRRVDHRHRHLASGATMYVPGANTASTPDTGTTIPDTGGTAMPGRGLPPKPPEMRARRNKDPHPMRVINIEPVPQPPLPTFQIEKDGELVEFVWPAQTHEWWQMWRDSPLSAEFTETDWSELRDTAMIHARFWKGNMAMAAELRQRVAKFGATPEDRARLRITFAHAKDVEEKTGTRTASAPRGRYGDIRLTG